MLFQTMMIEQTRNIAKMARFNWDLMRMPYKEAVKRAGDAGLPMGEAMKLHTREVWRMLPHFLFSGAAILGAGFTATMLAQAVRGRVPDDEDLAVQTWMLNAAILGAATGYVESAGHYRGLERQFIGPLGGMAADFIRDPGGTATRYTFRPFPVDFRPWFGYWFGDTPHDIDRSVVSEFRPTGGTSLSGVRAR